MTETQCAHLRAAQIEMQNHRRPPIALPVAPKTRPENLPCYCNLCDKYLDRLTNAHAAGHRYRNKKELIKAGHIKFLKGVAL